jgi:hypothetical protein
MLRHRLIHGSRVYAQAEQMWQILTAFVMYSGKTTITYGDLATKMGYATTHAGHTLGRPLGLIGKICLQTDLPPLNAIVVTKHGQPGDEVVLRPGSTVKLDQEAVRKVNWFEWHAPVAGSFRKIWDES